ncbi:tetratricopeptide repeat protein [Kitasatospora sp. NPDC094019]|uniref:tetratricopeptide repeat protein n=1 Tax=Kitasatospora sp. NPDC094019 TaxID=3364091 RepID=UPI00380EF753
MPASVDESDAPVAVSGPTGARTPPAVRVEASGEKAVGAGHDIAHSAVGQGSRVEHTEVHNRVEGSTVRGDLFQAGNMTVNNYHPAPPPVPVWRPVRVGAVPPLASAVQPRPGLREVIDGARERNATVVLTQVLSGGGGVGKTQLAATYARRAHAEGVDVLVWVNAADISQIVSTYARAAHQVGAPGADGREAERDAEAFKEWLATTDRSWLVVLDDLTDLEGAQPWWPHPLAGSASRARVLATTRRRDALVSGAGRAVVDIGIYTRAEALAYLRERLATAGAEHLLDAGADDLVEALGRLPLALAHAAAYMINEDKASTRYLHLFSDRTSRLEALLPPAADTDGYGRQVTASLVLALDAAEQREPVGLAAPAIRLAAHLDAAGHPQDLWATAAFTRYLTTYRAPSPGAAAPAPVTPDQARAAVRLLHQYALLTSKAEDSPRAIRLHGLTARTVREGIAVGETPATVHAVADALREVWDYEREHPVPLLTAVLGANTATLAAHAGDLLWNPDAHPVLFAAGAGLSNAGLYSAALAHWKRLAADAERLLSRDSPSALVARENLATSYRQAGLPGEAILIGEQVVADSERLLSHDVTRALAARTSLAASYREAGNTGKAIDLLEQVLAGSERLLGSSHPDTRAARSSLGSCYRQMERTGEAITLEEKALTDSKRLLGDNHPDTLTASANLAASYWQAGRTGEAIAIEEKALTDSKRLLGDNHPDTLTASVNLAASYRRAGRTGEAIGLLERVVPDIGRRLGHDHLHTLTARANLAAALGQAGCVGEAVDLLEGVVADCGRLLGHDHAQTLSARSNLAASYRQAWRTGEATELEKQVLAERRRQLGAVHPETLATRTNLASCYRRAGRVGKAILIDEEVLADSVRVLGDGHLLTLTVRAGLAASYRQAGRTGEAVDLLEQVISGARRIQERDRLHRQDPGSDGLLERLVRRAVGREWPGQGT